MGWVGEFNTRTHFIHSETILASFFSDASGPHRNAELNGKVFFFGKMRNCKILPPINSRRKCNACWLLISIDDNVLYCRYAVCGKGAAVSWLRLSHSKIMANDGPLFHFCRLLVCSPFSSSVSSSATVAVQEVIALFQVSNSSYSAQN